MVVGGLLATLLVVAGILSNITSGLPTMDIIAVCALLDFETTYTKMGSNRRCCQGYPITALISNRSVWPGRFRSNDQYQLRGFAIYFRSRRALESRTPIRIRRWIPQEKKSKIAVAKPFQTLVPSSYGFHQLRPTQDFSLQPMDVFSIHKSEDISSAYLDTASNRFFISRVIVEIVLNFVLSKGEHELYLPLPVNPPRENHINHLIVSLILLVIHTLDTPQLDLKS